MPEELGFTHFDKQGNAWMVDVGEKQDTGRTAVAEGKILVNREVYLAVQGGTAAKGDVLGTARVAGIMGAKRTADLIPLCHVLLLTHCSIVFQMWEEQGKGKYSGRTEGNGCGCCVIEAVCTVKTSGKTGVEMEALMGVNAALLTIYDMCKALDRAMVITDVCLRKKEGGRSGTYERPDRDD